MHLLKLDYLKPFCGCCRNRPAWRARGRASQALRLNCWEQRGAGDRRIKSVLQSVKGSRLHVWPRLHATDTGTRSSERCTAVGR